MKEFLICFISIFSLVAAADYYDYKDPVISLNVSVPWVLCTVEPHPSPSTALMDCRYKDGAAYSGQKGFVYKGVSVHALVVHVYDSTGRKKGMRFLKNPPETLRYYLTEDANTKPWILKHKNLRSILRKGDSLQIVYFQLDGSTKVYEDSGFRFPKEGSLGSKVKAPRSVVKDTVSNAVEDKTEVLPIQAGEE